MVAGQSVDNLAELNQFLMFYLYVPNPNLQNLNEQVDFTLY